jgi:hypothetical protein
MVDYVTKDADDTAPAVDAQAVVTNDLTALPNGACVALYIGVAGNVKIKTAQNTDITFVGLAAGSLLPVRVKQVFATGTTATNIIALY